MPTISQEHVLPLHHLTMLNSERFNSTRLDKHLYNDISTNIVLLAAKQETLD
jgi:hypothetical protein